MKGVEECRNMFPLKIYITNKRCERSGYRRPHSPVVVTLGKVSIRITSQEKKLGFSEPLRRVTSRCRGKVEHLCFYLIKSISFRG